MGNNKRRKRPQAGKGAKSGNTRFVPKGEPRQRPTTERRKPKNNRWA